MRLKKLIMINRVPFDKLILNFDDENIAVLSGINAVGKTTLISHIVELKFKINMDFVGYLPNPIEVTQIANWIMDNERSAAFVFNQLSLLLSSILIFKLSYTVHFGIGKRNEGTVRLSMYLRHVIRGACFALPVWRVN